MTQIDRDAKRNGGCASSGTFRVLISASVPGKVATTPEMDEQWIKLGVDAELPIGGAVAPLYRSGPGPLALSAQNPDPLAIPQNEAYAEIECKLTSDGVEPVRIAPGGAALTYSTRMPTLVWPDRSPFPGGSTIFGLRQAYARADYQTKTVAGLPRPAAVTERIGRLDGWQITFATHDAERMFKENMLETDWIIESPFFNAIHSVRLYDLAEGEPTDFQLWDEIRPENTGEVTVFQIEKAAVMESGELR